MASLNTLSYLWGLWKNASSDNIKTDINRIGGQIAILRELHGEIEDEVAVALEQDPLTVNTPTTNTEILITEVIDVQGLHETAQIEVAKDFKKQRALSQSAGGGSNRKKNEYGNHPPKPSVAPPAKPINSTSVTQRTSRNFNEILSTPPQGKPPVRPIYLAIIVQVLLS